MTFQQLEQEIISAYTEGVTMEQAEKLAAKCLHVQMRVSSELRTSALDSRMRKSGLKAVKANIYMDAVSKADKKPTEAQLTAILDTNDLIAQEQDKFDIAESDKEELERMYDISREAHIYFRGIAKGTFGA